ncbi:MAG: sulfite exporter TauE/SafE family protein [Verrucomicrobiota bacterium]
MTQAEFALAAAAVVLIGFSKAGLGGGTGILATPLMVLALGAHEALGIMLPLLILCDWGACLFHRKSWDWPSVAKFLPLCIVGIACGTLLLGRVNEIWLQRFLGIVCISFCLVQWFGPKFAVWITPLATLPKHHILGWFTGFTSTLAHAAGPVVAMYLIPLNFPPKKFVATSVLAFTLINLLKLPSYLYLDMIQWHSLKVSLQFVAFIPLGIFLGIFMLHRIKADTFKMLVYAILFLTGLDLIAGKGLIQLILS